MKIFTTLDDPALLLALQKGSVCVIPTDTIYGLAAYATDKKAVAKLYALKKREHKPGTVIAANIKQLLELGVNETGLRMAAHLWPNPVSVVLDSSEALDYLHMEVGSLAVRIPKDPNLQRLLEQTGPLVTSSANRPGEPPAETIAEAHNYFGDRVDAYVDGGALSGRPASTVVRLQQDGRFQVLREGAVTINEKGEIVHDV